MHTTLRQIEAKKPCRDRWRKGMRLLGKTAPDSKPIAIIDVLDKMGLDDAIWCLRAVKNRDRDIRLLAVAFASEVKHRMKDKRSLRALEVATAFANGEATEAELKVACRDAYAAYIAVAGLYGSTFTYAAYSVYSAVSIGYFDDALSNAAHYAALASADFDAMCTRQAELLRAACANG